MGIWDRSLRYTNELDILFFVVAFTRILLQQNKFSNRTWTLDPNYIPALTDVSNVQIKCTDRCPITWNYFAESSPKTQLKRLGGSVKKQIQSERRDIKGPFTLCICVCVKLQHCVYGMLRQTQRLGIETILCVWCKLQKYTHSVNGPKEMTSKSCTCIKSLSSAYRRVDELLISR